jgi:hypothetical protein
LPSKNGLDQAVVADVLGKLPEFIIADKGKHLGQGMELKIVHRRLGRCAVSGDGLQGGIEVGVGHDTVSGSSVGWGGGGGGHDRASIIFASAASHSDRSQRLDPGPTLIGRG